LFINLNAYYVTSKDYVFSFFLNLLCPFESWSNPRFDQDLNQFKT
jgi:hypothetical protein